MLTAVRSDEEVESATLRVVVCCADGLYGRGTKLLLESTGIGPVFLVDRIDRATRMCSRELGDRREVALWITDRLDGQTAEGVQRFRGARPQSGFCILATEVDARVLRELARAQAGFLGVVLRRGQTDVGDLSDALLRSARGESVLDPRLVERMLAESEQERRLASLTAMERGVLELLASGLRNHAIASQTRRSEKAVEKHVSHIFVKLGLHAAEHEIDRRVRAARLFHQVEPPPPLAAVTATPSKAG